MGVLRIKGWRLLALLLLAGCAGGGVQREKPAEQLFKEAISKYEKKSYEEASALFQELTVKHPMSSLVSQAKLKMADAYFYDENYPEAISAYRDFEKLYPTNENIPYVIYQLGMCYFKQMLTIDRDQTATRNAAIEFLRLVKAYPKSLYTEEARKNIEKCMNDLAESEVYVGSFYFKKEKYKAAAERFALVLSDYPAYPSMDKVLFFGGQAFIKADDRDRGRGLLERLLKEYPSSIYIEKARALLEGR